MRERLIELLNKKYDHFCDQCGVNKGSHYTDSLADYLIENGVVVPPCKVGDEVYYIINGKIQELRVDYGIFDEIDFTMSARCKEEADMCEYSCSEGKTCGIGFGYSDIGKTVFLSREDAEAKLKEGAE